MPIPWLAEYNGPSIAMKRSYELLLGKMIQPVAEKGDLEVEYLNSSSVQWSGVEGNPDKTMWASPREVRNLTVKRGDLLICEGGDVGRAAIYDGPPGRIFQNSLHRARSYRGSEIRYLKYLLAALHGSGWLDILCNKATIAHLTVEKLGCIEIPCASLEEQRRIADFLDVETARIDALRASRLSQVSVLDELELARIGKHLSAVETVGPVYAYFDVQLGKMLNAERASGDSQHPYLRNANVHWYEIDTEEMATMTFEPDERLRYGVWPGDLLVCEGGAGVGEAAVWDGRIPRCFYQKSLHRVRSRGCVPVEWLMYWLRYAKAIGVFDARGNIATIPHLTGEQLAEHRIPIPQDGHRRVAELGSEIAAIRETQRKMACADTLLTERRQALITAAVTGQIDVTTARGAAI
jgi:type I restriction enzyme, S subunit